MFKAYFLIPAFAALIALPAHAAFIVSRDGVLPAQPTITRAAPKPLNVETAPAGAEPLLAAVPNIETEDTSSDPPGSGFVYTTVVDTNAPERLRGATAAGSGGGGAYNNTSGYDNFNAFHDVTASAAEIAYHTQGSPANYRGAPYQNYRGYGNTGGYSNTSGYSGGYYGSRAYTPTPNYVTYGPAYFYGGYYGY